MATFSRQLLPRLGLGLFATAALIVSGCAKNQADTATPETRTVLAAESPDAPVYVQEAQRVEEPPADNPDVVGYETLSDGTQVQVVQYVHTYPEPVETYPRVYWSGRWYYNINGDFVYWSSFYGGWCYYWGPPRSIVVAWNWYYPWAPYYWGVGFYGPGWYWGGVGVYGYHAYGIPVHHHHHHHHGRYASGRGPSRGGPTGDGRRPSTGGPTGSGKPPSSGGPSGAGRMPTGSSAGTRQAAPAAVADTSRSPRPAASPGRQPTQPNVSRYTTAGGQDVTVVSPPRAPTGDNRGSRTIGSVPSRGWTPADATYRPTVTAPPPARDPGPGRAPAGYRSPAQSAPSGYAPAPSAAGTSRPTPSAAPSRAPSRAPSSAPARRSSPPPTYSTPSRAPSRSPGRAPSRSSSPSRSFGSPSRAPSRSSSPGRSSSPSRAPSRAPSRGGGGGRRPR